jgi:flagellar hook-associated protein 2
MGSVITSGIGSGLDIAGLVSQLVAAEGQATTVRLDVREAKAQSKLSAIGTLRSALDELRSALADLSAIESFRGRGVTLSDESFVSAIATTAAVPGAYSVEVERLATSHRLASAALVSPDAVVGTGTLTLAVGPAAFALQIDDSNNTLAGIASAINSSTDNPGIQATLINGVDGTRLLLSAAATGAQSAITVRAADGDGGLDALVYDPGTLTNLTEVQAAQDARALINSFPVESDTNSIASAIDGVEFALIAPNAPGETTQVVIDYDKAAAREQIEKLVESYNALLDVVGTLASRNPETGETGPLFADAGLRNIVFQLRRELSNTGAGLDGPFGVLQDLGIEAELDGELSIDPARLDAAFAENFDAVGEMIADPGNGLAVRLDQLLETYLKADGVLDGRNGTFSAELTDIADQRERLADRLAQVETRLFRQFNALDTLLAQLQSTSSFLTQQLANLPGAVTRSRGDN